MSTVLTLDIINCNGEEVRYRFNGIFDFVEAIDSERVDIPSLDDEVVDVRLSVTRPFCGNDYPKIETVDDLYTIIKGIYTGLDQLN